MKLDIRELGAAMAVCSGYKWLLGPYGSGFFWVANEWIERLTLGSIYFMALEGARNFHALPVENQQPVPGARRWDSAETANFTNLAAFDSSLDLLLRIGTDAIAAHTRSLVDELIERLPRHAVQTCFPGGVRSARTLRVHFRVQSRRYPGALRETAKRASACQLARERAAHLAVHLQYARAHFAAG